MPSRLHSPLREYLRWLVDGWRDARFNDSLTQRSLAPHLYAIALLNSKKAPGASGFDFSVSIVLESGMA